MHEALIEALNWRYSVNEFDTNKKVSVHDLETLLEVARLAPSSFGLQPWKFAVVENKEKREAIKAAAWGQAKVTDASHLLVVLSKEEMDEAYIEMYVNHVSKTRNVPVDALKGYHDMMVGAIMPRTPENRNEWMALQSYIPVGMLIEAAALLKIDAAPMEGFNPAEVGKILGITGYTPRVLIGIGYRSENDKASQYKKVRMSKEEAIVRIA
jgi:nitroreductase